METKARRLTKQERNDWEKRFQRFMLPKAMLYLEGNLAEQLGDHYFTQSGLQFAREAHIAGNVAYLLNAKSVRLVGEARPDCEMIIANHLQRFEITEADEVGRRRGDEYKAARMSAGKEEGDDREPKITHLKTEEVLARADQAPEMLARAAELKANGDYDPGTNLIIYLNLMEFGWRRAEVEAAMPDAITSARAKFRRVIVLWQDRLYPFPCLKAAY